VMLEEAVAMLGTANMAANPVGSGRV
jgi:hypothetical protein